MPVKQVDIKSEIYNIVKSQKNNKDLTTKIKDIRNVLLEKVTMFVMRTLNLFHESI